MTLLLALLLGCPSSPGSKLTDTDGDGLPDDEDCAPDDASAGSPSTWYADADGDGYGDPASPTEACDLPAGHVVDATDCDDAAADVHPGAPEVWYDGADEDCAGDDDFDQDGDGWSRDEECDDTDPARSPSPSVPEVWYDGVDDNCDGNDGDQDGDGWYVTGYPYEVPAAYAGRVGDCADDPVSPPSSLNGFPDLPANAISPDATETFYDGVDADCGDDDDFDADRDGQHTAAWPDETGVAGPDCDDFDALVYAGAPDDWYDGLDADCLGNDDYDQDGDGWGIDDDEADCDDLDATAHPGAVEDCALRGDQDCDGTENGPDAIGCVDWYSDTDGDGYGGGAPSCECAPTVASPVTVGGDCADADARVYPGAQEFCDGVDQDCDGAPDRSHLASIEDSSGGWTEVTGSLAGAAGEVMTYTLPTDSTLWLCEGTWTVRLLAPAALSTNAVVGRYGAATTTLDALLEGGVIEAADNRVTLSVEGVTITGGSAEYGGGIASYGADLTLQDVDVVANSATHSGGGVFAESGSLTVVGGTLDGNSATQYGAGVYAVDAEVTLDSVLVTGNHIDAKNEVAGGGVYFASSGAAGLSLASVEVSGNAVTAGTTVEGGGVYAATMGSGGLSIVDMLVDGTSASAGETLTGGGMRLVLASTGPVLVTGLTVTDTVASAYGGAGGGLAIHQEGAVPLAIDAVTLTGNVLQTDVGAGGGGLFYDGEATTSFTLSTSTVSDNQLTDKTGSRTMGSGGGVYLDGNGGPVVLDGVTISGNDASDGDGLTFDAAGGSQLQIVDSAITDNRGIGVTYVAFANGTALTLEDSRVTWNDEAGVTSGTGGMYTTDLRCTGARGVDAGVYGNGTYGYIAACLPYGGVCTFTATSCDLGPAGTADDNGAGDVYMETAVWGNYGSDASFVCTGTTCL